MAVAVFAILLLILQRKTQGSVRVSFWNTLLSIIINIK